MSQVVCCCLYICMHSRPVNRASTEHPSFSIIPFDVGGRIHFELLSQATGSCQPGSQESPSMDGGCNLKQTTFKS